MISERKVELMSKIALYEQGEGRETLKLNKYYRKDFEKSNILKSVPRGIIAYILILFIIFVARKTWVVELSGAVGMIAAIAILVASFIVFVALYCLYSYWMFSHSYDDFRGNLRTYDLNLRRLSAIYEEERKASQNTTGLNPETVRAALEASEKASIR